MIFFLPHSKEDVGFDSCVVLEKIKNYWNFFEVVKNNGTGLIGHKT